MHVNLELLNCPSRSHTKSRSTLLMWNLAQGSRPTACCCAEHCKHHGIGIALLEYADVPSSRQEIRVSAVKSLQSFILLCWGDIPGLPMITRLL